MRSGATQVTPTSSPDIRITVGGDTYTSQDNGRLLRAYLDEQVWGGQYIFEIDNDDESLTSKDYVGSSATIHLSFIGSSGSDMSPVWVHNQQLISKEGKLVLQLNCIDAWGLLSQVNADLASAAYNQNWQQSSELDERTLPSGEPIPEALKTAIEANYDKTIFDIIEDLIEDTLGISVTKDDDDGIVDTRKPPIRISNPVTGVRQLLDMTESYLKWKTNGTFGVYQPSNHATVYTFNAADLIFNNLEDVAVTIPNRVTFYSFDSDGDEWISGTPAVDSDSYTALGVYVDRHYLLANMDIDGRSDTTSLSALAAGALTKIQGERSQGMVVAPMHCSLELFDKVQVDDYYYDTPRSTTGYIHRLIREYDRGIYRITIQLGGVTGGYTPPGGNVPVPLADDTTPDNPVPNAPDVPDWFDIIPKAIQGYTHDITFSSTDWDTVAWTSGTLTFYDGTTQAVSSGNTGNLSTDDIYYIYFDLDDASPNVLKVATATAYQSSITEYTSPLCVVQRRSGATASFLPGWEKQPLIVTDMIYMQGLVDYDYGGGKYLQTLLNTQVTAGQIRVSSSTSFASDYDPTDKFDLGDDDLDDIDDGSTYARLRQTDISGGHIKLTDAVVVDGEWYNESGVEIDANNGINIYGTDGALTTRATKTGTIQCKVDSSGQIVAAAGDVILNSTGIHIVDESIVFYYGSTSALRGSIWGGSSKLQIESANGDLVLYTGDDVIFTLTSSNQGVDMDSADWLILPTRSSEKTSGQQDGMMIYNSSTGYLNVYSTVYGDWWHVNRDADWA